MKAIVLHEYGGPDQLRYEDAPTPKPGVGEVLIKVAATSVNPVDGKLRGGSMKERVPLKFPAILGRDVAGTVVETGPGVTSPQVGQEVIGLVNASYAEYLTAKAQDLTVLPGGLPLEDAAALPLVTLTGAQLAYRIRPQKGDVVLVTGALGGVGRTAVYVLGHLGARVIAGVKKQQKTDVSSPDADRVMAIDDDEEIGALPELDGVADTVDGEVIGKLIPKVKPGGVVGSVLGPPKAAEGKNLRVEAFMATPDASLLRQMADAVRDRKLIIPIVRRMKLSEAAEAHALAEKGSLGGKILLIP